MDAEAALRDKLRNIEAPFAGAATAGEKAAAGAAAECIRTRLRQEEEREKPVEIRFSLPDPWSRQMFIALCRRYGLRPYRYSPPATAEHHGAGTADINAALAEYMAQVSQSRSCL